jgi:carboxymethylenebutenolidase
MRRNQLFGLLTLVIFFCLSVSLAKAQQPSCCIRATGDLALYSDPAFITAHEAPREFHFVPVSGSIVTFKSANGPDARGFLVKSPNQTKRVVLVFHEWWGMNDYIEQEAEWLQKQLGDVDVIAVDLFDGKVAKTADEASKLTSTASNDRMMAIIQGAIDYAGPNRSIGTLGWCFGGGWSLQAAILAGKSCTACVMYYGMPETNQDKLAQLKAPVMGFFGLQDKFITPAKVNDFRAAMRTANRTLNVKNYNADHAFANPSNPHFDKVAKEDSERIMVEFFKKHLGW